MIELFDIINMSTLISYKTARNCDWNRVFATSSPNEQVAVQTNIIMSIVSNFVPKETSLSNDRDPPSNNTKMKKLF